MGFTPVYLKWMLRLGIEVNCYACEAQCVSVFVSAVVYGIVMDPPLTQLFI